MASSTLAVQPIDVSKIPIAIVSLSRHSAEGHALMECSQQDLIIGGIDMAKSTIIDMKSLLPFSNAEMDVLNDVGGSPKVSIHAQRIAFGHPMFAQTLNMMVSESSRASVDGSNIFFRIAPAANIAEIAAIKEVEM